MAFRRAATSRKPAHCASPGMPATWASNSSAWTSNGPEDKEDDLGAGRPGPSSAAPSQGRSRVPGRTGSPGARRALPRPVSTRLLSLTSACRPERTIARAEPEPTSSRRIPGLSRAADRGRSGPGAQEGASPSGGLPVGLHRRNALGCRFRALPDAVTLIPTMPVTLMPVTPQDSCTHRTDSGRQLIFAAHPAAVPARAVAGPCRGLAHDWRWIRPRSETRRCTSPSWAPLNLPWEGEKETYRTGGCCDGGGARPDPDRRQLAPDDPADFDSALLLDSEGNAGASAPPGTRKPAPAWKPNSWSCVPSPRHPGRTALPHAHRGGHRPAGPAQHVRVLPLGRRPPAPWKTSQRGSGGWRGRSAQRWLRSMTCRGPRKQCRPAQLHAQ